MPDADQPDTPMVTVDGIHIEKRLERGRFPIPTVEFTIRSDREDPTELHLIDEIPESIPMENVGFHPEYGSQYWTAYENHHVRFDRTLEPGEEVMTVYGIRTEGELDDADFLAEPVVSIPGTETAGGIERLEADDIDEVLSGILDDDEDDPISDLLSDDTPSPPGVDDVTAAPDEGTEPTPTDADRGGPAAIGDDDQLEGDEDTSIEVDDEPALDADVAASDEPNSIEDADIGESIDPEAEATDDSPVDDEMPEGLGPDSDALFEDTDAPDDIATPESDTDQSPFDDEPADPDDASGSRSPLDSDEGTESEINAGDETTEEVTPFEDDVPVESADNIESMDASTDTDDGAPLPETETETEAEAEAETEAETVRETEPIDEGQTIEPGTDDRHTVPEGNLVGALVEEIREDRADAEDLEVLAEHLDAEITRSRDIRLHHVQARVDDLAAYTDALEEFIDDNGTAAELIEDFERELDELRTDLVDMEGTVGTVAESQDELRSQLDAIESAIESVEAQLESATTATEQLEAVESQLDATTDDVEGMTDEINSMKSELSALSEDVGSVANEMEALEGSLIQRIESVESEVESVTNRLKTLETWRENLTSALGSGTGSD